MNAEAIVASVLPVGSLPFAALAKGGTGRKKETGGTLRAAFQKVLARPKETRPEKPRELRWPHEGCDVFGDLVLPSCSVLSPAEQAKLVGLRTLTWVYQIPERCSEFFRSRVRQARERDHPDALPLP